MPAKCLGKRAGELVDYFLHESKETGEFHVSARVGFGDAAIVVEIVVEPDLMVGVDFGGSDFGVYVVGVANPAVAAVPVLGARGTVFKSDEDFRWEDEVALAMNQDVIAVFAGRGGNLGGVAVVCLTGAHAVAFAPPGIGIGVDVEDFVIEDGGSGDGLIE